MNHRYKTIRKITLLNLAKDCFFSFIKIVTGWWGNSHALLADGIHSLTDVITNGVILVSSKYSAQHPDEDHPYGHARFETAASLFLALLLVLTGVGIIVDALQTGWVKGRDLKPEWFVLVIALLSVLINEATYRYTRWEADRIGSDLLHATAIHSRGDAASSLIVLVGILGSILGLTGFDAFAAVIVGVMIGKTGWNIGWKNLRELVDTGVDEETLKAIQKAIFQVPDVKAIHELRTRQMAGKALVEVHIIVEPTLTVSEGHHIGEKVMESIQSQVKNMENVIVHVDSENDEAYSSTSPLPLRSELLPLLEKAWSALPRFNTLRLHYLEGKIRIELEIPLSALQQNSDLTALKKCYEEEVRHLPYIVEIKIVLV